MLRKIISGGQSGVDRAALDAAIDAKIPHGGFCPRGRWAEDGIISKKYKLVETDESDVSARTIKNIINSDATLIIIPQQDSELYAGTRLTIEKCQEYAKPVLLISLDADDSSTINHFIDWMEKNNVGTLNIAGPRESHYPGIYQASFHLLKKFILSLERRSAKNSPRLRVPSPKKKIRSRL